MELEEAVKLAGAELDEAEAQLRAIEGRVAELRSVRDGLRYAVQRWQTVAVPFEPSDPGLNGDGGQPTAAPTQTDLCIGILRQVGRPVTTIEVRDKLLAAGNSYSYDQVRSALGYLLRVKRIKRVGPGLWEALTSEVLLSVDQIMASDADQPGRPT